MPCVGALKPLFRDLKHTLGLLHLHAKKVEFILQEIFAKLTMYNVCELITQSVVIQQRQKNLELLTNRLAAAQNRNIGQTRQRYISLVSKLDAMSPLKVLMRGYAMAQTEMGTLVRSIEQVEPGEQIRISLSDGKLTATVVEKRSKSNESAE